MATDLTAIEERIPISKSLLIDIVGLAIVYFVPTLSHLLRVPLYLVEPMRLMLIIAIAHTTRRNAFIIALTLPLFSFVWSGHPVFLKSLLITIELVLNVWLFYVLARYWRSYFAAILVSIVASKLIYYLMKYGLINAALLDSQLISTSIYIQLITLLIFSGYVYLILSRREADTPKFTDPTK
jgi:hypothetical protein